MQQWKPQLVWDQLLSLPKAERPDLFVWTGDTVYTKKHDLATLRAAFDSQRTNANYTRFVDSGVRVEGVYDDHDYGENDGGRFVPDRAARRDMLLDFLGVPVPPSLPHGAEHTLGLTKMNS